jgi:hypothetical protein
MKSVFWLMAAAAYAQPVVPVDPALAEIAATHRFLQAAISPDGAHVAYVEALAGPGESAIYIAPRTRVTAGDGKSESGESAIAWCRTAGSWRFCRTMKRGSSCSSMWRRQVAGRRAS